MVCAVVCKRESESKIEDDRRSNSKCVSGEKFKIRGKEKAEALQLRDHNFP